MCMSASQYRLVIHPLTVESSWITDLQILAVEEDRLRRRHLPPPGIRDGPGDMRFVNDVSHKGEDTSNKAVKAKVLKANNKEGKRQGGNSKIDFECNACNTGVGMRTSTPGTPHGPHARYVDNTWPPARPGVRAGSVARSPWVLRCE